MYKIIEHGMFLRYDSAENYFLAKSKVDKIAKEIKLLNELNIANYQGASKILLSQNEQIKLKLALKNYAKNEQILKAYKELGIDLNLVKNSLENISQFSPISFDEFNSQFDKNNPLEPFIYDGDTNLIFISSDVGFSDEFDLILQKYNASYFNLTQSISNNFTIAKEYAIYLKLLAYVCAFGIFLFFFIKENPTPVPIVIIKKFVCSLLIASPTAAQFVSLST